MKQILPYVTSILLVILLGFQYFNNTKLQKKLDQVEKVVYTNKEAVSSIYIPTVDYGKITEDVTTELQPVLEEINNRVTTNSSKLNRVTQRVNTVLELTGNGQTDSSILKSLSLLSYQIATLPKDTAECFQFRSFNYNDSTLTANIDVYMDDDEGYLAMDYRVDVGTVQVGLTYPDKGHFGFRRPKATSFISYSNPNLNIISPHSINYGNTPKLRFVMGVGMMPGFSYDGGQFKYNTSFGFFMGMPILKYWGR